MRTKTKIIRVIENFHMPTVIKSIPNWINSNSKISSSDSPSSSSSSILSSPSSPKSKAKPKLKSKLKSQPIKITTIENINVPSKSPEMTSKYNRDYISKAFIDTFSNQFSTEKRTIILDELLQCCSPTELNLLKKIIDKNLSEISPTKDSIIKNNNFKKIINKNSNIKKNNKEIIDNLINKNKNKALSNNNDRDNEINIKEHITREQIDHIKSLNTNVNYSKTFLYPPTSTPVSSQNYNESLFNELLKNTLPNNINKQHYSSPLESVSPIFPYASTPHDQFNTSSVTLLNSNEYHDKNEIPIHDLYNYNNNNNAFSVDYYSPPNIIYHSDQSYNFNSTKQNTLSPKINKKGINSPFDKLADELLIIIFSYLDTQSLAYASQVNCRWYSLLRDNLLWKDLCNSNEYSPFSSSNPLKDSDTDINEEENNTNELNHRNNDNQENLNDNNTMLFTKTKSIQQSMVPIVWKSYNYKNDKITFSSSKIPSVSLWNIPWKKTFVQNWRINCNWKTGRCKVIKKESVPNTLHMAFNNNLVFSVQQGKRGVLWDIFSGESIIQIFNDESMISAACFNKNYLVIGCINYALKVWDLKTKELVHELEGHHGEIVSIQNDDEKIISGDENSEIKIWNIKTGTCETTLKGHEGAICTLQFKNNILVSGSVDTTIKIWNIKAKKCIMTLSGHTSYVYCIKFNDHYICSGSGDNTIKIWSLKTGKCLKTLKGHEKGVVCLQFDHQKLISGSVDETIKVWNIKTGKCLYTLLHHNGSIWNLYYNNTHMISSSFDHSLCIWDFASDVY